MKKIIALSLVFLLLISLVACGGTEAKNEVSELEFSPLLRLSLGEGGKETRIFYLPESAGVLYLYPSEEGFAAGFVSSHRSILAEKILSGEGTLSEIEVREAEKDRFFLSTENGIYTLILDGLTADSSFTPYPEKAAASDYHFFDELTLIGEAEELLLLLPVNLSEVYVLAQKKLLSDFGSVLTASKDGKKIWYTREANGEKMGIGFFEYGKNTPLGTEQMIFDSAQELGAGKVLFSRGLEDGGAFFLYRDLEQGSSNAITTDEGYDAVTCTPDGKTFAAIKKESGKGRVDLFNGRGEKTGSLAIPSGEPYSLALSQDGEKLFLAVIGGEEMVLGSINLA